MRWADPGNAFGISGKSNNRGQPTNEGTPWPSSTATAGDQAGQNEDPISYHSGGVNALLGDESVKFLKDSVDLATFRGLLMIQGGETISSISY